MMPIPFQFLWRRLWRDPPPGLVCEFTSQAVAAARWTPGDTRPEAVAVRPLPQDVLRPSPVKENLLDTGAVGAAAASALNEVMHGARGRGRNIALLLPDLSARVTVLQFEQVPAKQEEISKLLKFRLKKSVPFEIEDAAINFNVAGQEVVAAVAPRGIIQQYESVVEKLGYNPGLVTLSTLAGLGLIPEGNSGGTMLLRREAGLMTIAIGSHGTLRMMRVNEVSPDEDLFHDIYSSAVFFQDNYGARLERIYDANQQSRDRLPTDAGAAADGRSARPVEQGAELWDQLEAELGVRPKPLIVPGASPEQAQFLGIFGMLAEQARA